MCVSVYACVAWAPMEVCVYACECLGVRASVRARVCVCLCFCVLECEDIIHLIPEKDRNRKKRVRGGGRERGRERG